MPFCGVIFVIGAVDIIAGAQVTNILNKPICKQVLQNYYIFKYIYTHTSKYIHIQNTYAQIFVNKKNKRQNE